MLLDRALSGTRKFRDFCGLEDIGLGHQALLGRKVEKYYYL